MARSKRDKRTEKRHGRAADVPRRPTRRKPCRSAKKLAHKLRRCKSMCTICRNSSHGRKQVTICGHVFHRECLKMLRKNGHRKCPNCRTDLPTKPDRHNSFYQPSIEEILAIMVRPVPPPLLSFLQDQDNQDIDWDVSSPNLDNSDIDLDNESSYLDNSDIDLDNESSYLDNSSTHSVNSSSDFHNSSTDSGTTEDPDDQTD